jgi:polyisoprenoid-binding protein YceI
MWWREVALGCIGNCVVVCLAAALAGPTDLVAQSGAKAYRLSPGPGSKITLEVEKTGLLRGKKHIFTYERFDGAVQYQAAAPERSSVRLSIESASIVCQDDWLSESDRKKVMNEALTNMMSAAQYPRLEFVSTSIRPSSAGRFEVDGNLKIRDRIKPAKVGLELKPQQDATLLFEGDAIIRLTDYGLKPPSAALGAVGTKDEMRLRFVLLAKPE